MRKYKYSYLLIFPSLLLLGILVYNLSPVKNRLAWRIEEWRAQVRYMLNPPEQAVFVPQGKSKLETPVVGITASPSQLSSPPVTSKQFETSTPTTTEAKTILTLPPSQTPTLTPTPPPQEVQLAGFRHEYQGWNNCGPATLVMALSYWGWLGDQYDIADLTKPNPRDKNVMPDELVGYVESRTQFRAVARVGGEVELLRRFLAVGLPVLVEKGFEGPDFDGWMGHYVLLTGYSETDLIFTMQDSYYGPDQVMSYVDLERYWRSFNFTYLVIYPGERESEVLMILGSQADKIRNEQYAAQKAGDEARVLTGRDRYFAWFNRGSSLVALQDYVGAAEAYDTAFTLYTTIPEKERPWRMMWYQTGPYLAYFYADRYQDVIDLATSTLDNMNEPVLEESYYWRAMAREAQGELQGAIEDLQASLKQHPGFIPTIEQLERLGLKPQE